MTSWLPDRAQLRRPYSLSLVDGIAEAIEGGAVAPGERLPTHRALAEHLGLSIHTVTKAYDELRRRGLVSGHVGRGTFVGAKAQPRMPFVMEPRGGDVIDLSLSRPVSGEIHAERMTAALAELGGALDYRVYLACRPNVGLREHREAALVWLRACGLEVPAQRVLITNGVSHGITLALTTIARPGDVIATEAVGHHGIISLAAFLGLRLRPVAVDSGGLIPEAFEEACREGNLRGLFTVPSLAGPMVSLLSEARRRQIAATAARYRVAIVEDDAWGPLAAERPPPLAAFAPEISYYATSFTKCLMPGLRSGYLVVPERMVPPVTSRMIALSWMGTPLIAELSARWVLDGTAQSLVRWQRQALEERYRLAEAMLSARQLSGHPHALHLWLTLPEKWRAEELVEHAKLANVAIAPAAPFLVGPELDPRAVRVALGAPQNLASLERGLATLSDLLARDPEPLPLAV